MIGTSPTQSLLSLLFSPLLSGILFLIYKFSSEIIRVLFDLGKNIKYAYANLFKKEYFLRLSCGEKNNARTIVLNIYSGLFFALMGVVLSVYYYIFADGKLSLLGPFLVLFVAIVLDKTVGKYSIFYKGALIVTRLFCFIPLSLIKLYCLAIDKICKINSK